MRILRALGRPRLAAVVVAAGALVAAGCGSSSTNTTTAAPKLAVTSIEKAISQTIHKQHGITTVVTCPKNAPRKAGYQFYCTAALDAGTYAVVVRELNARGGVAYSNSTPLNVLDSHRIALAITETVRSKRHLTAAVTCPASILQAKGLKFTCTAKIKNGTASFLVTETDAKGHVSFVGL